MEMNRDELKKQGLSDEQIEAVLKAHGKVVQDNKEKSEKLIKNNKTRIEELEKENKTLSDGSDADAELKKKYDELEEKYSKSNNELTGIKKSSFLNDAIKKAGGKDADYIKYLLEKDGSLELSEDGTIAGLDEKITKLKESDSKYFEEAKPAGEPNGKPAGFTTITNELNGGGTPTEIELLQKQVNQDLGLA